MTTALEDFDRGVEAAEREYTAGLLRSTSSGFSKQFASFVLYDVASSRRHPKYIRVDLEKNEEPILWKYTNRPFARLLRTDQDIGATYAGFATLFTIDRTRTNTGKRRTAYYSMAIDAPLDRPGFVDASLSRSQFVGEFSLEKPLPLTAVCLGSPNDADYVGVPIIFHWRRRAPKDLEDQVAALPKELRSWGHIFVSADLPYDKTHGLHSAVKSSGFSSEVWIIGPYRGFSAEEFSRRLRLFAGSPTATDAELANQLAWTVTYFAYACESLGPTLQSAALEPLQELAIICVPASSTRNVSSALYLPVFYHANDRFGEPFVRACLKTLYLARALGLPMERLKEFSASYREGVSETLGIFAHEIKAVALGISQGWSVSLPRWEQLLHACRDDRQLLEQMQHGRVLPVPLLYEAVRDCLVLWSQTDKAESLYEVLPHRLSDVIRRSWEYASRLGIILGSKDRNFARSKKDVIEALNLEVFPIAMRFLGDDPVIPRSYLQEEEEGNGRWICTLTRLLVALFDNYHCHGDACQTPEVEIDFQSEKEVRIAISNIVARKDSIDFDLRQSSQRPGMTGREVLRHLATELNARLQFPDEAVPVGGTYRVQLAIPW